MGGKDGGETGASRQKKSGDRTVRPLMRPLFMQLSGLFVTPVSVF